MVAKSPFRNWHVDAYLEGRVDEIPEAVLPIVAEVAERRKAELAKNEASETPVQKTGWEEID